MYVLDSLPMFIALVLLNVIHPGRIMPGKESDLPSRKERKAAKRYNKVGSLEGGASLMGDRDNPYPVSLSAMEMGTVGGGAYQGYDDSRAPSPFEPSRNAQSSPQRIPSPYDPTVAGYRPPTESYTNRRE